ncbi:hypothetical protein [Halobacterium zhouii]|uniref:hypothetical protein n=1 Tax=Halobacterium zhouii TaxID=2902624 RepID=UPI001E3DADFF|nr:hypothetical protein [Halobacterium zhouii]
MSLVVATGLTDPLINFLTGNLANLGDLGTITVGLGIGLVSLALTFARNEAQASEFSTIEHILYGGGILGYLSIFLSDTVNQAVSGDPAISAVVVAGGVGLHYAVSAADTLGEKIN